MLAKELKITDQKSSTSPTTTSSSSRRRTSSRRAEGAENILKQFPDGSQKVGDYVDTSLLDGLKKDGFFAAMQQKYELKR